MNFTFELTEQEAQVMLNALAKEPYGVVVSVITKVQKQAGEQINNDMPSEPCR